MVVSNSFLGLIQNISLISIASFSVIVILFGVSFYSFTVSFDIVFSFMFVLCGCCCCCCGCCCLLFISIFASNYISMFRSTCCFRFSVVVPICTFMSLHFFKLA